MITRKVSILAGNAESVSGILAAPEDVDPEKTMGGRVASQMVAEGLLPVSKLVFLGYPLHAPGKKISCVMPIFTRYDSTVKVPRLPLFCKLPALHDFIL